MKMPLRCLWMAVALLWIANVAASQELSVQSPPNIVLLVLDDVGQMDLSVYNQQAPRTTNLDALAAQGVYFRQALLTTSSCSSSRASIITGRYPSQTEAPNLHDPLPAEARTLAYYLRQQGYYTAALGKWHLGDQVKQQFELIVPSSEETGTREWLTTLAERPKDRPFFFWLAPHEGHLPYTGWYPPLLRFDEHGKRLRPWLQQFWQDFWRSTTRLNDYFHELQRLDRRVGDLMQALDEQSLRDNTLLIVISDNGPQQQAKGSLYDRGLLTPLIVRYPPLTDSVRGRSVDGLVSSVDLAPTLLQVAGVAIPAQYEGMSLLPMLQNPQLQQRNWIYAEAHRHDEENFQRLLRTERYAYKRNFYQRTLCPSANYEIRTKFRINDLYNREELYDVQQDPAQLHNLIDTAPPVLAQLRATMNHQFARVNQQRSYPRLHFDYCGRITFKSIGASLQEIGF